MNLSSPQRLPLGIPCNENSNFRKIESARGTMGRGKNLASSLSPSHCPPRAFFFLFSSLPTIQRGEREWAVFEDVRVFDLFECIQTQTWLKWIAEVSSWSDRFVILARKVPDMHQVFRLINLGALVCCLVGNFLQSILVLRRLHLRSRDATATRGIILYISHKGMYRPKGYGFCAVLVWKWVYTLPMHFGLESGMVFEETTGVYERIYRFISKCIRKKEK